MASTTTPLHSTTARRPTTFAALALAAATALAAFSSQPVLAQPASPAPVTATVADDAPAAPNRPMPMRMAPERERMQGQSKEQRMERMERMQGQGMEQRMERMQQRRAEHMAQVKAELQLTPAQEPAWADFTASMQPGQRHAQLGGREGMENLTTPERIDRMRAMRIQRAAEADRRGDAVKTFYSALSAPQQKTFDQQMHNMQESMYQGRMGGPGAKSMRGGNQAKDARGVQHRSEKHRQGMQRRDQDGAARVNPSAAPAMPTTPAQ